MTRWMLRTLRGMDTPTQWASGLALGSIIGWLPPDSLLPYVLGCLLVLAGANMMTGAFGVLVAWMLKPLLANSFESFGYFLLTHSSLQSFWVTVSEMPVGNWCRFENTMVTGALVGGFLIAIPLFLIAWIGSRQLRRWMASLFERSKWTVWLVENSNDVSKAGVAH